MSKMKLVDLIPLKEIDFTNQKSFDAYNQKHQLRPDTKVTIAGKVTTAGKAAQKSAPVKGTSVFNAGPNKPTDVKSTVKALLKHSDPEFGKAWKLKDTAKDISDSLRVKDGMGVTDADAAELKQRLDKGEDGIYVQQSEMGGTIVFKDGSRYEVFGEQGGNIYAIKK